MTEKFLIIKQFDTEKLSRRISEFECKEGYAPYIFMNNLTWQKLYEAYRDDTLQKLDCLLKFCGHTGLIGKYKGYKTFEDNTLEFGEIELR